MLVAGLLLCSLIVSSSSIFRSLENGAFVKKLDQGCKLEKFKVGPETTFLLESELNYTSHKEQNSITVTSEYVPNLGCKEWFKQ